jgi:hypothetical protein
MMNLSKTFLRLKETHNSITSKNYFIKSEKMKVFIILFAVLSACYGKAVDSDDFVEVEEVCIRHVNITDGPKYVKTVCTYVHPETYSGAQAALKALGMKLFELKTDEQKKQFHDYATSIFGHGGGSTLWIAHDVNDTFDQNTCIHVRNFHRCKFYIFNFF